MLIWLQFFLSAVLVIVAGRMLASQAEKLAQAKGLTRLWLGFILLAGATSMPELATAIGAVTIADSPSLALGDLLGSNAFNIFIIALLPIFVRGSAILRNSEFRPCRLLLLFSGLMTIVTLGSIIAHQAGWSLRIGHIGAASLILLFLYLISSVEIFRDEKGSQTSPAKSNQSLGIKFFAILIGAGLAVVGAGCWLSSSAEEIATITGWGSSFVGALLLALVTSLPELVVCVAAVRMGSPEMALGNIFGSNIFNLTIIFWTDLAYGKGPVLGQADQASIGAGFLALLLTLIVSGSLLSSGKTKLGKTHWDSALIAIIYLLGMYTIFRLSSGA